MINKQLVDHLTRLGYVKTPLIRDALLAVDRGDFVPDEYKREAYENQPLPIGFGQTISQPLTVAFMLELLQPQPGDRILDVGAGSGWATALLAWIVSRNGKNSRRKRPGMVVAIERIEALRDFAKQNIGKYNFIEKGIVELVLGDGSVGYALAAPYDKIIAAAAADSIRVAWKQQLKTGGTIVAPVKNEICVLRKISATDCNEKCYSGFSFVPLVTHDGGR